MNDPDVLIVGAGLAGLAAARHLLANGRSVQIYEASDDVGGRVRTDEVEGFRLDRGFQVLLDAYPEAQRVLNYRALDLQRFYPGARIQLAKGAYLLGDPFRSPLSLPGTVTAPVGTLGDKLRIARLRRHVLAASVDDIFKRGETTTLDYLRGFGFGEQIIERFFRPFYGGIFLEEGLETSSRLFEFTFRMFSQGSATVPALGMGMIPRQMADALPAGVVQLNRPVAAVTPSAITLDDGSTHSASAVIVATDAATAARLLPEVSDPGWREVTTLYFAAAEKMRAKPLLWLSGERRTVNNFHVVNAVAPETAPEGQTLLSVTILQHFEDHDELLNAVRNDLFGQEGWIGWDLHHQWRHLRTYRIPRALPNQAPPALSPPQRPVALPSGVFVCGDHRDNGSINGAFISGRRAANAVLGRLAA